MVNEEGGKDGIMEENGMKSEKLVKKNVIVMKC
jgi:hypothetical protein